MSKIHRSTVAIGASATPLILVLLLFVVASGAAMSKPKEQEPLEGPGTLGGAFATPDDWDYDPAAREIVPEESEIVYPIARAEEKWRELLDEFEFYVLREKGTEYAYTGPLNDNKQSGIYYSRATGQPLFSSYDKFDSRTGWPSFTKPINPDAIVYIGDTSFSMLRIEVVDSLSGSHLGHVFNDGPAPTGQRYCINSASLLFVPDGEELPPLLQELQRLAAAGE